MTSNKWVRNAKHLEKTLGFILDCPRCRAWSLKYHKNKNQVHIKCLQCNLEIIIPIQSLINKSGTQLPVIL